MAGRDGSRPKSPAPRYRMDLIFAFCVDRNGGLKLSHALDMNLFRKLQAAGCRLPIVMLHRAPAMIQSPLQLVVLQPLLVQKICRGELELRWKHSHRLIPTNCSPRLRWRQKLPGSSTAKRPSAHDWSQKPDLLAIGDRHTQPELSVLSQPSLYRVSLTLQMTCAPIPGGFVNFCAKKRTLINFQCASTRLIRVDLVWLPDWSG
jgi:hypothetical protein